MGERGLTAEMKAAVAADVVAPLLLFEASFPSGTVRIWSGVGELVLEGEIWYGLGSLISVDAGAESMDGAARDVKVTVSGLSDEFFSPVMIDGYQGHPARMLFAVLDPDTGEMIGTPYTLFSGKLDSDNITDDGQGSIITITTTNILADLLRARELRYTHEHQQRLHPGDKGLEFVASLQDLQLKWGSK